VNPSARRWVGPALGLLAVLAVIVGVTLVVTGGEEAARPGPTTTQPERGSGPTLPLAGAELDVAGVERISGLEVPAEATDFLSASLDRRSQLDVTFTIAPDQESALLRGSGLPEAVPGERVILHSSPLWELNPEGDAEIRGTAGERDGVQRALELVPEGDRLRVRVVITPA
jgi:hypothetical protein